MTKINILPILLTAAMFFTSCSENSENEDNSKINSVTGSISDYKSLIVNRDTFTIQNISKPTDFELKHTPEIVIGETDEKGLTKITIKIGSNGIVHPSVADHWIDYVEIITDSGIKEKINNEPGENTNKAVFNISLKNAKEIKCTIGCNLHGIWSNSLKIK